MIEKVLRIRNVPTTSATAAKTSRNVVMKDRPCCSWSEFSSATVTSSTASRSGGQHRGDRVRAARRWPRTVAGDGDVVERVGTAEVELLRRGGVEQRQRGADQVARLAEPDGADQRAGDRRLGTGGDQPDGVPELEAGLGGRTRRR